MVQFSIMKKAMPHLIIVGGGLAGCEAAWQAAQQGVQVMLYEMRPLVQTGAHITGDLAELVCSNSLGSKLPDRANGLLIQELGLLDSLLIQCAFASQVPAGGALAVDRQDFARRVNSAILQHPNISLTRQEVIEIPQTPVVIATGPLTSPRFADAIKEVLGQEYLFFYDAIAPIVTAESIDMQVAFKDSRYGRGKLPDGDYINCPMDQVQYEAFVNELLQARRAELRPFETTIDQGVRAGTSPFFEACLPIETIAGRGLSSLAFGPLSPIGILNSHDNSRAYAVVQLRQDNLAGTLYNMVGFQTNLTHSEQARIFRMIPGLAQAEFVRFGHMHRNTYIASPQLLLPTLQSKQRADLFFAGQITAVEGYIGNIATGWLAGVNAVRYLQGRELLNFPPTTILGALSYYITQASMHDFQPMKANFGLLPPLPIHIRDKQKRNITLWKRCQDDFINYLNSHRDQ
jgi:methylenetetrahydrofolate--tRNA-(uracil-5-)-methyltransferase